MLLRRVVYRAIFPLAVLLPIWVLITHGIIADGIGWEFVAYLIISPILFVALLVTGGLISLRPDVSEQKAVSWPDAVVLLGLWLTLIVSGFYAVPAAAVLAVLLLLALFWLAISELIGESGRRMRLFSEQLNNASQPPPPRQQQPLDIGEVIVVTSREVDPKRSAAPPANPANPGASHSG